jgi:predicted metalloprotease with PDZ domain
LKVGDRIIAVDGFEIGSRRDMNLVMAGYRWGDLIQVDVQREDEDLSLPLALTRMSVSQ